MKANAQPVGAVSLQEVVGHCPPELQISLRQLKTHLKAEVVNFIPAL